MDMHIAADKPLTGIDIQALPPAEGEASREPGCPGLPNL